MLFCHDAGQRHPLLGSIAPGPGLPLCWQLVELGQDGLSDQIGEGHYQGCCNFSMAVRAVMQYLQLREHSAILSTNEHFGS
jgi:hypothetical protein